MNKIRALEKIAQEIAICRTCKVKKSGLPVPGEGNPDADIVFLGEAPGKTEAKIGRPFIGRSGQLLRTMIRDVGLLESDVYITSPVKYLPDRGTPTKEDIKHGRNHLFKQFEIIQPKIIVLLGKTAMYAMLSRDEQILKRHGTIISENNYRYLLTLHPAAVLRFPKYAPLMKEDFLKLTTMPL